MSANSAKKVFLFITGIFISLAVFADDINIITYGAIGDGKTLNTEAIQRAIDDCSKQGGGRVLFPQGTWLSGTILLKNNVYLFLDKEATLLGSTDINTYQVVDGFKDGRGSSMGYCFIGAIDVKNTGITGKGKINGNGKLLLEKNGRSKRPFLVRFVRCTNLTVSDVQMEGPAAWTMHFFECKNVKAERLIIRSRGLSNNDGIDIDCCQDVLIKDCDIDSGDDAICFKTTGTKPCKNITITGCRINTGQGAFKIGTESIGDFKNISISKCEVLETKGIKLYSVDGGHLKNLKISDITIEKAILPIMIRLGARLKTFREGDTKKPVGSIKNLDITNIQVKNATQMAILISGIPGHYIENVRISNVSVNLPGGGTADDGKVELAENIADYPELTMFGKIMPASGVYIRNAGNIMLDNINLAFAKADARPLIIAKNAHDIKLAAFNISLNNRAKPLVMLNDVQNVKLKAIAPTVKPAIFLQVEGKASRDIFLDHAGSSIELGQGVQKDAVKVNSTN